MAFPVNVDSTWVNSGASYDAGELRRADTAMFGNVAGGIVRHTDNSLAVTIDASDNVTIQAGAVVIPGNAVAGTGVYRSALPSATTNALTARSAVNPRIDLVVFRQMDTDVVGAHAAYTGRIEVIAGTPSATPSAPALPSMAVELARINVPISGGGTASVDSSFRTYATGLGGALPVVTAARLPASAAKYQKAVALDTGTEYQWNGTAWQTSYNLGNSSPASGFTQNTGWSRFTRLGGSTIHAQGFHNVFQATGTFEVGLPVNARVDAAGNYVLGSWWALDAGTAYRTGVVLSQGTDRMRFYIDNNVAAVSATVPFTWANGDVISWNITYEAA